MKRRMNNIVGRSVMVPWIIFLFLCVLNDAILTEAGFVTEDGEPVEVKIDGQPMTRSQGDQFRSNLGIAKDVNLTVQEVPRRNTFRSGKTIYALDGDPLQIFTSDATYLHDGKTFSNPPASRMVQIEDAQGKTVTISNNKDGDTESIMVVNGDGTSEELVAIAPGVLVTIKGEDIDEEELQSEFSYSEPLRSGTPSGGQPIFPTRSVNIECEDYRQIEVAVVYDSTFCAKSGGTQDGADQAAMIIMASVSNRYQQPNMCIKVEISHLEGYCNASVDPYKSMIARKKSGCRSLQLGDGLLNDFRDYWNQNRQDVKRDVATFLSGTEFDCGNTGCIAGCANLSTTCQRDQAYSVNHATYKPNVMLRSSLVAHELAHNNGAQHYNAEPGYIMGKTTTAAPEGFSVSSISSINGYFAQHSCIDYIGKERTDPPASAPSTSNTAGSENEVASSVLCRKPLRGLLKFSPMALLLLVCTYPYQQYIRARDAMREMRSNPPKEKVVDESSSQSSSDGGNDRTCSNVFC